MAAGHVPWPLIFQLAAGVVLFIKMWEQPLESWLKPLALYAVACVISIVLTWYFANSLGI